jgi:hypothetical protein
MYAIHIIIKTRKKLFSSIPWGLITDTKAIFHIYSDFVTGTKSKMYM